MIPFSCLANTASSFAFDLVEHSKSNGNQDGLNMANRELRLWRCHHGLRTPKTTYTITQITAKAAMRSKLQQHYDINAYYVLCVVFQV
jgi:hypothetical protein